MEQRNLLKEFFTEDEVRLEIKKIVDESIDILGGDREDYCESLAVNTCCIILRGILLFPRSNGRMGISMEFVRGVVHGAGMQKNDSIAYEKDEVK